MNKKGGYDNNHPREQQAKLDGFGARALAAHQNSFEALLVFSVAVFSVLVTNHVFWLTQFLALSFIISRFFYHAFYLLNWATLRSLVWFWGYICCLSMLLLCIL